MRDILDAEGVPPFSENASELMTRTLDIDASSAQLARVILKDVGLTSQLLRVANSALYNRSQRPIISVAHAVTLLGWENVRRLVSAVRYVEHFASRSPGLRELMLMSVLTALHCRDLACLVGYRYPEDAYLAGLFRNLGEVLVACYRPEQYARIIMNMHAENMPEREACLAVMGFSWDEVAERVAREWNMPRSAPAPARGSRQPATARCVGSIADYAHALTHAEYRKGCGVEAVNLKPVIDPSGRGAVVVAEDALRIVKNSLGEAQQLFVALQIPAVRLRLDRQAELARAVLYSITAFDHEVVSTLERALDRIADDLSNAAAQAQADPEVELTRGVMAVLNSLCDAGFERAVFALANEEETVLRGRLAAASGCAELLRRFTFRIDRTEGPIYAAMHRRVDVLVDRVRDDRYDGCLMTAVLEPSAFALFPVTVNGKARACLYADRRCHTPGLDSIRPALGRARDILAAAFRASALAAAARS